MAVLEVLVVVVMAGLLVYGLIAWLMKATGGEDPSGIASRSGRWRTAHYDDHGQTRVVLQKLSASSAKVLDEHTIASIPSDDPDYEDRFLAAMLAAHQRQALFESEEE